MVSSWLVGPVEHGGSTATGIITWDAGAALLVEGDSHLVQLEQTFTMPMRPETLPFDLLQVHAQQLVAAGRFFQKSWGRVDRFISFLEQLQVPVAVARDELGISGMSGTVARNFRDKNQMKTVLRDAGLPVARQALVTSTDDARRFVSQINYPVVIKPIAGLGSRGTMRCSIDDELYAALNAHLPSPKNPV